MPTKKTTPKKRVKNPPMYAAPISDLETEFALHVLRGTGNVDESLHDRIAHAARICGMTEDQGKRCFNRKDVKRWMEDHKRREAEVLVQMEVRAIRKKGIGRAELLAHFDRLASMDPERTRGSITGQVAAAVAAATMLGFMTVLKQNPDDLFKGRTAEELKEFARTGRFHKTIEGETRH